MSNAIFAPNFNPPIPGSETVYVINYWDYNLNLYTSAYGPFYPKNLTIVPDGKKDDDETMLDGTVLIGLPHVKMTPNSFVGVMTKKEYNELVELRKIQIAQLFIQESTNLLCVLGRSWVDSLGCISVDDLTIKNVKKVLFGNGGYDMFLPKIADGLLLTDKLNSIFGTYCQFGVEAAEIDGFRSGPLADCGKCLPHEAEFMNTVVGSFNNIVFRTGPNFEDQVSYVNRHDTKYFQNIKLAKQKPKAIISNEVPNCDLCKYYVVFCSGPYTTNNWMNLFGFPEPIRQEKGLSLSTLAEASIDTSDNPNVKFFETLEEANDYFDQTINNTNSKWICKAKGMAMGPDIPYECIELLEPCAIEYANSVNEDDEEDIVLYNTQIECEDNCNKLWYCIEYQCVKINKDDPIVEELDGYETEQECTQFCEIPTPTPIITPTPNP